MIFKWTGYAPPGGSYELMVASSAIEVSNKAKGFVVAEGICLRKVE